MKTKKDFLRVAVHTPLRRTFDYLPNKETELKILKPGIRVSIPFGKQRNASGVIISINSKSEYPYHKLKKINYVIDESPVIDSKHLDLLIWASTYYHHPIGEVIHNALPTLLRKNDNTNKYEDFFWSLSEKNSISNAGSIKISAIQKEIIKHLKETGEPINDLELKKIFPSAKRSLISLEKNGLVRKETKGNVKIKKNNTKENITLNEYQDTAINKILASINSNCVYLLDGLTGSGKTEVYMTVMENVIESGNQCLVLLPEIGLTPQLIQRFKNRFDVQIGIQHSGLSNIERLKHWQDSKSGKAKIILGTRSAIWTPLKNPGIYIIDEEHDLSYKQQSGFQYSARDLLVVRAKKDNVSAILGSATPSLETIFNANKNRYSHLILPKRAGAARQPKFRLLDIRGKKMHGPLSHILIEEIKKHLKEKNQVLLFLNRRGYSTYLYCHNCGWKAECERCEIPFTYHKSKNNLKCHQCGSSKKNIKCCPLCELELLRLGHGTEQIEEVLSKQFPNSNIARIDRDTTRKRNAMNNYLEKVNTGEIDILVGTQMITKGHHFPNVTLTAIIDADRGLFSTDFRASERLAQLFMQVSGRTGRGKKEGTVIVQTYSPDHPLFHTLIKHGYNHLSKSLLKERKSSLLPPYSHMAFLRVEAHNINQVKYFIKNAGMHLNKFSKNTLQLFGPIPALIEKHSGRFRYQLIIQASNRKNLHAHMDKWLQKLETMKGSKTVRWSLDIDPQDMS